MKIALYLSIACFLVSCAEQPAQQASSGSPFEAGGKYDQELSKELETLKKEEDSIQKARAATLTEISFSEKKYHFGTVKPESTNEHYFIVTNTGKLPLIIESVQASCGCTTPEKPEQPIAPGASDSIKVQFVPFPGMSGLVEKTVTIKSNTLIPENKLIIQAEVEQ